MSLFLSLNDFVRSLNNFKTKLPLLIHCSSYNLWTGKGDGDNVEYNVAVVIGKLTII